MACPAECLKHNLARLWFRPLRPEKMRHMDARNDDVPVERPSASHRKPRGSKIGWVAPRIAPLRECRRCGWWEGGGKVGGRTRALVTRRPDSGSPTAFQAISSRVVSGGWHKRCQSFYQLKTIWINFLVSILSWRHKRKRTITKLLHKYRVVFFLLNSTDRLSIGNGQPLARISTWDQWSRRTANKILRVQGSSSLILLLLLPLLL